MAKKIAAILMAAILAVSFTACGQITDTGSVPAEEGQASSMVSDTSATDVTGESTVLVAYFSWSGNTQEMAAYIAEQTGGDLLEIQPETPYPTDYSQCGDVALAERDSNARPTIANLPESIDQYDTILIGYPKMEQGYTCV